MPAKKATAKNDGSKTIDHEHHIPLKRGNGILRREVWVDSKGNVTSYNLAYINNALHGGDNGRVLGYDNSHGYHHRHYFGKVEPVRFESYSATEALFEQEWLQLHQTVRSKKEK
jgi:hypothetical protein